MENTVEDINLKQELIDSYNELTIGEKRVELGREIAELTLITEKMLKEINPEFQMKDLKEFNNLFDSNTSESEYLTGLYEDLIEMKEDIGAVYEVIFNKALEEPNDK